MDFLEKNSNECAFCFAELKDTAAEVCPKCNFPLHAAEETQLSFRNENAELEHLIERTDKALSWARFGMLWPWITAILVAAYFLIMVPRVVQEMIFAFSSSVIISCIFISCYFSAPKKPVSTLTLAFVLLFLMTLYTLYEARMFLMFPSVWLKMLVPIILLLMFGNALFLAIKLEKTFKDRKKV